MPLRKQFKKEKLRKNSKKKQTLEKKSEKKKQV